MSLLQQLTDDMKAAMRAKDAATLDVVRMTLSSVKNKAIEVGKELDDADVLAVVKSDVKKIKDALQSFLDNAREDLADKARKEIAILEKYLPAQMTDEDLLAKVRVKMTEMAITGADQAGKLVGAVAKDLKGQVDGSRIKEMVDKLLKS